MLTKELKEAISRLSSREKDSLIFRLLRKDLVIANQLQFELVNTESIEERREQVKRDILRYIERVTQTYYSAGYLYMEVRDMSGMINEHVLITKDKYGEASLNLWMINEVLARNNKNILSSGFSKAEKFCVAVIARAFKILLVIKKLHEDYLVEFKDDLNKFGMLIGENPYLMKTAIYSGFDVNWLLTAEIPDNLEQIHKDIRANGFLK